MKPPKSALSSFAILVCGRPKEQKCVRYFCGSQLKTIRFVVRVHTRQKSIGRSHADRTPTSVYVEMSSDENVALACDTQYNKNEKLIMMKNYGFTCLIKKRITRRVTARAQTTKLRYNINVL